MDNKRHTARLSCKEKCQLYWNGASYPGTVKNVSIGDIVGHFGMHFDGSLPDINIGDTCTVYLYDDQNPHDIEFLCQVIRINTSDIALEIIEMKDHKN